MARSRWRSASETYHRRGRMILASWVKSATSNSTVNSPKSTIRTESYEESLFDFLDGWGRVQFPKGQSPMTSVLEKAAAVDPPAVAMQYDQAELRLLVSICRQLQREAGDGPFFLSVRTAAELVGVSPRHAARWLNGLVLHRVLERVSRGDRIKRKASEFRYIAREAR